jgi:hypothetical protein
MYEKMNENFYLQMVCESPGWDIGEKMMGADAPIPPL